LAVIVSKKFGFDKKVLYVCVGISIASELTRLIVQTAETPNGYYLNPEFLPFHLCSIQIFFIAVITFTKNEKLKEACIAFMYPTLLGGGLMALLIPTSSVNFGFFSPLSFQLWIFHAMLIFLALVMILTKQVKPKMHSFYTALIILAGAFVFAMFANSAFGGAEAATNYFYIARPPLENLPLLNLNLGWYMYVFNLAWIAVLLISLTYIPIFVAIARSRAKEQPLHESHAQH